MKRILCLIDSLGAGGAQRQMVGLATFLKERGYGVMVAFYHEEMFYSDFLQSKEVPFIYLKQAERNSTRIYHIARYIRKFQPDVVIAYLFTPCICASLATLTNHKFKLIVSERNTNLQTGRNEKIRFNLFRRANFVVPNSFSQEEYIKQQFPFLGKKVVTIPNFVDLDFFTPPEVKRKHAIPEILIAASIWPSKNTLGFIEAVAQLKIKGYKFHVSWYGKSEANMDYYNLCQNNIKQHNIEEFIELKEKTTQIKKCYQESDFFCLPSFYEGTPNVICEAMACGLPVACSNICDNSRYVVEKENGFLFDPKDVDSMVSALIRMLAMEEKEYYSFCVASRKRAEKKLSKESFVNSYIKLIEQ